MQIPTEWLRDYVTWDVEPVVFQQLLNNRVSEVEEVDEPQPPESYSNIIVGRVVSLENDGTAEGRAQVEAGGGKVLTVVAPAKMVAGQKYALALTGAVLPGAPDNGAIKEPTFCSEKNLGLGRDDAPVMLSKDVETGSSVYQALRLDDRVYHFDLEPHRPDLFSVLGFAREVAALCETRVKHPSLAHVKWEKALECEQFSLMIEAPSLVNRYAGIKLKNIKLGPSPQWLQNRLRKVGVRPRNNIVDITNYVTFEYGQPLHAFDYSRLAEHRIVLRQARANETMLTLDGKLRTLDAQALLVADAAQGVAIAGIIGNEESSVSETTTEVLLESANFDMTSVRRTSRLQALRTEASIRFEKGPDAHLVQEGLERAVWLMQEYAGAEVDSVVLDYYPRETAAVSIDLSVEKMNDYLGSEITAEQSARILSALEFGVEQKDAGTLHVTVPPFRPDVGIFEDLVEEIGRVFGYDNIPYTLPEVHINPVEGDPLYSWQDTCRNQLAASGFSEIRTDPWMGDEDVQTLGLEESGLLELRNYLSVLQKYLRTSPFPTLLRVLSDNLKKYESVRAFELGKTYERRFEEPGPTEGPAVEKLYLAGMLTLGRKKVEGATEFYMLKAALLNMLDACHVHRVKLQQVAPAQDTQVRTYCGQHLFEEGTAIQLAVEGEPVGVIGYLSRNVGRGFGIEPPTSLFYLSFDELRRHFKPWEEYVEPSKMPSIRVDLSLTVDTGIVAGDLQEAMVEALGSLLVDVQPIDSYEKEGMHGKKSITFSLEFNDPNRSLRSEEVQEQVNRAVAHLAARFGAELRL